MIPLKLYLKRIAGLFLLPAVLICTAQAQHTPASEAATFTLIFKGEPIELALLQLVQTTDIDLIYDPAIITDHMVFKTAKDESAENILRKILDGSGLDFFQLSSGTYVLIRTPQQKLLRGNLSGWVVDAQTGEPLTGANIMLAKARGGASSSGTGFFNIPHLQSGPHEITITYVGYKPRRDTVWVPTGQTTGRKFSLSSEPVLVEPLVISGIQKKLPSADAFSDQLGQLQIQGETGFAGSDAVKSLNTVSGIDFSLPLADFNIQGGNAGEHLLRLDGVPIYNPVSMGRLLGAFSPYAIKKITINKAGFSTPVGSQLSGIIDVEQDLTNAGDNSFLFQLNPLNVNARFDHSFIHGDGPEIDLMFASRVNIWRWYKQPDIRQTLQNWDQLDPVLSNYLLQADSSDTFFQPRSHSYDISYYDLHMAARIKHNAFHQTRVYAYHGKNFFKTNLFSENTRAQSSFEPGLFYSIDQYNWLNTMAKIEHDWLINSRFDVTLDGYMTHHSLDHNYSITNNVETDIFDSGSAEADLAQSAADRRETGDQNAIMETSVELNVNYSASKNYSLRGGLSGTFIDYRFHLSDLYYNSVQSDNSSFLIAGYIHNDFLLSEKTELTAGTRLTFVPSRDLVFAEPRLSFKHDEPETSIGYLSFQLSGGIYRQFINQFDVSNVGPSSLVPTIRFWVPIDYTTTVPKAYHVAGDFLWEPNENWQFRIESYYKWIPSRLVLDYENLSQFPSFDQTNTLSAQQQFIVSGRGYSYGTGLTLEKNIPDYNLNLKASYQLNIAKQRIPSRFNGDYQPLPSSQPHNVNASVNWKIKPKLTFLMQWQGIWGRSWGFRKAYYDYLSIRENRSFGEYSFQDPGDDTLPAFSQLNAGISYTQPLKHSAIRMRLDVFNVLDHTNVLDWWLSPVRTEQGTITYERQERTLTGFMPSLSVKFSY